MFGPHSFFAAVDARQTPIPPMESLTNACRGESCARYACSGYNRTGLLYYDQRLFVCLGKFQVNLAEGLEEILFDLNAIICIHLEVVHANNELPHLINFLGLLN